MYSKQMSYCSLEEAWGENYAKLYKKDESMLPKLPEKDQEIDETILNDRKLNEDNKKMDKYLEKYYNKNKKNFNQNNKNFNQNNENFNQDNEYFNKNNENFNKNNEKYNLSEHCPVFEHFLECEKCKKSINKLLNINGSSSTEGFINNINEKYFDIIIIVLGGIFIIFMLDCFVRLGKNLKK